MSRQFVRASNESLVFTGSVVSGWPITGMCWAYPDNAALNHSPMSVVDSTVDTDYWLLFVDDTEQLVLRRAGPGGTTDATVAGVTVGAWNHCAFVQSAADNAVVYINGTAGTADSVSREPGTPDGVSIGRRMTATPGFSFDGRVRWPVVYDVALSATEIAAAAEGRDPRTTRRHSLKFFPTDEDIDLIGGLAVTVGGTPTIAADPPQLQRLAGRFRGRSRLRVSA